MSKSAVFLNIKMTANVILYSHLINKVLILNYILDVILSIFCSTSPIKLLQTNSEINLSEHILDKLIGHSKTSHFYLVLC